MTAPMPYSADHSAQHRMPRRSAGIAAAAAVCALLALPPAWSLSYVPIDDAQLLERADAVVRGRIAGIAGDDRLAIYTVTVDEVLKGLPAAATLQVVVPGAPTPGDRGLHVHGAPRFVDAESVLLFLARRADGRYAISELALGAFHARADAIGEVLARDLSAAERVGPAPDPAPPEHSGGVRDAAAFAAWLRARARGAAPAADYWRFPSAGAGTIAKYRLQGPPQARWFEFDQGGEVPVYAHSVGLAGFTGGGYAQVQAAVEAWNNDAGSTVRLRYGGLTSILAQLLKADRTNTIVFNDPYDDIPGSFDCNRGGVVATTAYFYGGDAAFKGASYARITEFDVVVQQNTACLLSKSGGANLTEALAHEIGHGLGVGHSCGDSRSPACSSDSAADAALMRAQLHADGRGAYIGSDDCLALQALYPASGTPDPGACASVAHASAGDRGGGAFGAVYVLFALLRLAGAVRPRLAFLAPRRRASRAAVSFPAPGVPSLTAMAARRRPRV